MEEMEYMKPNVTSHVRMDIVYLLHIVHYRPMIDLERFGENQKKTKWWIVKT